MRADRLPDANESNRYALFAGQANNRSRNVVDVSTASERWAKAGFSIDSHEENQEQSDEEKSRDRMKHRLRVG